MEKQQILEQSRALVNDIYEKMSVIETCDAVLDSIKDLSLCFNDNDEKIITLDGVLKKEQIEAFGAMINDEICKNQYEAQVFLERLTTPQELPFTDVPNETQSKWTQPTPLTDEDINNLVNDYVSGKTLKAVAKEYHIGTTRASDILNERGVMRKSGSKQKEEKKQEEKKEIDFTEAVELHSHGMTLGEIAAELGCKKSEIHDYFEENGISTNRNKGNAVEYLGKYGK